MGVLIESAQYSNMSKLGSQGESREGDIEEEGRQLKRVLSVQANRPDGKS